MLKFLILYIQVVSYALFAGLLSDYDRNCNDLDVIPANIPLDESEYYFDKKIPKNIFQIWFGDPSINPDKTHLWGQYSKDFGYNYRLFTEADIHYLEQYMLPENYFLLQFFLDQKAYHCASDVVRIELLKNFGGIYVDCDFYPPKLNDQYIDLVRMFRFNGLVLVTEPFTRNIGNQLALFCMNGFIASSKDQPVITHVCHSFEKNFIKWTNHRIDLDAMYLTGPFVLNKALSGSFILLPLEYLIHFSMYE